MWSNNYIGIPYKANGRDRDGLDCWGLARLIYSEQFHIDLPSFDTNYHIDDNDRIKELIAQYSEGWKPKETPESGDLVLFRILGEETHLGVCISSTHFIHVREGMDVAIESLENPKWNRRISGYFKYSSNSGILMNAVPHPLKTERVTVLINPGTTLDIVYNTVITNYSIPKELCDRIHILVNGIPVPREVWAEYKLQATDVVEYRAVAGKSAGRMILTLVVAYIAFQIAGPQAGAAAFSAAGGVSGGTAATAAAYTASTLAAAATLYAGSYLINAILPIRLPGEPADPGSSERQLMVEGGRNAFNPYGAIPVVLGKIRLTPPQGARTYVEYGTSGTEGTATRDSYLKMLLVWGYGPLYLDESTLRIGDTPLSSYNLSTNGGSIVNLTRISEPTAQQLQDFNAIYSEDVTQIFIGSELTYQGQATTAEDITYREETYGTVQDRGRLTTTYTLGSEVGWTSRVITKTTQNGIDYGVDRVTISLHFPMGLRRIETTGSQAGLSQALKVKFGARIRYSTGTNTWTSWTNLLDFEVTGAEKDAVTYNITYVPTDKTKTIEIAVRRLDPDLEEQDTARNYSKAFLQTITAYRPNLNPCIDPPKPTNTKLAKTAIKIKATENLNGQIEGINAVVQTYCRVWNGTNWNTLAATSNPAALFLYVLTHPGNPQRVESSDEINKINFAQLQYWYNYCQNYQIAGVNRPLQYNGVLGQQRGVLEVLRDICAAGRGSPALVDGKWSVVIDEPRTTAVQHFTPHNSWGFESVKALPRLPDALKVTFYDENNDYQEKEIIVPAAGYTENTAELFESISLPGITSEILAEDFARWHYAQIKLRPEVYTINTDLEYLVCNRGDLVKVTHDVPMWGSGSGRIKNRLSTTQFELDEEVYIDITKTYTIRVRSTTGASVTRTLANPVATGYYKTISVTTATTATEIASGDLFMFGELNKESQDLIVISIEPTSGQKNARITLVDYGVTETYNIFTGYRNLTGTVYSPNMSLPPPNLINSLGSLKPTITITQIDSDESTMEVLSPGVFRYNIRVPFTNPLNLPVTIEYVEGQIDRTFAADAASSSKFETVALTSGGITFKDVEEGKTYKFRLRYITSDGRVGLWTDWVNHTVVGKTSPPSTVIGLARAIKELGIEISWNASTDPDYKHTDLRYAEITAQTPDPAWSSALPLFKAPANKWIWPEPDTGNWRIFAKHVDVLDNESTTASQVDLLNWTSTSVASLVVEVTNPGLVTTDAAGNNPVLTGSGTNIQLYQGNTLLKYDGVGTTNGRWRISTKVDGNGIVSGAIASVVDSVAGDNQAVVGNLTGFTATDSSTVTYTIVGKTTTGKSFAVTKVHRYTKTKNGATGAPGTKYITVSCFNWLNTSLTTAPTASATYNWSAQSVTGFPTSPSTWSASAPSSPGTGYTLYRLDVVVSAAGDFTGSTPFNWSSASINIVGFRQDGAQGKGARVAFIVTTSNTAPAITSSTVSGDSLPTTTGGTWSTTATSNLSAGDYLYQVDGLYDPVANTTTWGNPYLSNLKVGSLSALAVNTGQLTMDQQGSIKSSNNTGFNTAGIFLGYDTNNYKFSVVSGSNKLTFDGTNLTVTGTVSAGSFITGSVQLDNSSGTSLSTIASNASSALSGLTGKLDKQTTYILGTTSASNEITLKTSGYDGGNGIVITNTGILGKKNNNTTFALDNNGDATFAGSLNAATGTFAGTLSAVGGSFTGTMTVGTDNTVFKVNSDGSFQSGHATFASAPFRVTNGGVLTATSATITGTLAAGSFITGSVQLDNSSGTSLSTIASNASSALSGLTTKLEASTSYTLTGVVGLQDTGGIRAGTVTWNSTTGAVTGGSGVVLTENGLTGVKNGVPTFSINTNGDATFAGSLNAATGTFAGTLSAVGGSFTGTMTVGTGNTVFKVNSDGSFQSGHATFASAPFRVTNGGVLTATSATITGTLAAGSFITGSVQLDNSSGTSLSTIASNASSALSGLTGKLDKQTTYILGTTSASNEITLKTSGYDTGSGIVITNTGILGKKNNTTTFAIDNAGNATFSGDITGATGTFGGSLSAVNGSLNSLSVLTDLRGGNYTGYTWPASGLSGFYLSPSGFLLGNYNDSSRSWLEFQTGANGYLAMGHGAGNKAALVFNSAGLSINFAGTNKFILDNTGLTIDGKGTFSGALSAVTGSLGSLTLASGGQINAGAFTGFGWPSTTGDGFHLGPQGLLFGSAAVNNSPFVQIGASGYVAIGKVIGGTAVANFEFNPASASLNIKGTLTTGSIIANTVTLSTGTALSTIETNAANGNSALSQLSNKLDKQTTYILGTTSASNEITLKTSGYDAGSGLIITNTGILGKKNGSTTFAIDNSGNATFAGALSAATGTFAGTLSAATGSFSGTITASGGTIGAIEIYDAGTEKGIRSTNYSSTNGFAITNNGFAVFRNANIGGINVSSSQIYSTNYNGTTGTGFQIANNGYAEFFNVKVKGEIAAGGLDVGTGNVRGGKSSYNDNTAGFFLGNSGGTYAFSIGTSSKNMKWDGSDLYVTGGVISGGSIASSVSITFSSFTASISGGDHNASNVSLNSTNTVSRTASASGGTSPYSYQWLVAYEDSEPPGVGTVTISNSTSATATINTFSTANSAVLAQIVCYITDANGRIASAGIVTNVSFGSGPP